MPDVDVPARPPHFFWEMHFSIKYTYIPTSDLIRPPIYTDAGCAAIVKPFIELLSELRLFSSVDWKV